MGIININAPQSAENYSKVEINFWDKQDSTNHLIKLFNALVADLIIGAYKYLFTLIKPLSDRMMNLVMFLNSLWRPLVLRVKTVTLWRGQVTPLIHRSAVWEQLVEEWDEGAVLLGGAEDCACGGRSRARLVSSKPAQNRTFWLARAGIVIGQEALRSGRHWVATWSRCRGWCPAEHLN